LLVKFNDDPDDHKRALVLALFVKFASLVEFLGSFIEEFIGIAGAGFLRTFPKSLELRLGCGYGAFGIGLTLSAATILHGPADARQSAGQHSD
jgi:hypothetical protein